MGHPRERRLVQYRKGLQLALRPTVDTDAPKQARRDESDALEGLMSLFNEPNSKRQAVANNEPPPLPPPEPMNVDPPAQPIVPVAPEEPGASDASEEPVAWELEFENADKILERLRALTPSLQQNILTLMQTAGTDFLADTEMIFVEFQSYNPDSAPVSKQAGSTGKEVIWFEKGFNPGGSIYPRNELQGDAVQVNDKNKLYFRVRVSGDREPKDAVLVTLHVFDQEGTQVTKAWAESQVKQTAKYKAAPGPFLNPNVKAQQDKVDMSTVDQLTFPLDINGFAVGPNNTIPELTIKHTDRSKGGIGSVYRKFYLKITLQSDPTVYVTTPKFNIFGRVADEGRAATANLPLPEEGYRKVLAGEKDPAFRDGKVQAAFGPSPGAGPSSGAGSSADPLVATVVPPPTAAPDPA